MNLHVLMIDDDEEDASFAEEALRAGGYTVMARRIETAAALEAALIGGQWDLILCDYQMPSFTGLDALAQVQQHALDLPFILVSGTIGEETAIAALKAGADDYVMKGNPARLVPSVERALREVAERRRLRQAEGRYRRLVEMSPDAIALLDLMGVIQMANRQAATLFQYAGPSALIGQNALDLLAPHDRERGAAALSAGNAGAVLGTNIYTALRSDGAPFFELQSRRVHGEGADGEDYIMIIARDITERTQAEARLTSERDLLQTLIDAVPDAIFVKDAQSRFLRVNAAQARLLGAATSEAMVGKTDLDYYPPALAELLAAQERHMLATGDPVINDLEDQSSRSHGKRWILVVKGAAQTTGPDHRPRWAFRETSRRSSRPRKIGSVTLR